MTVVAGVAEQSLRGKSRRRNHQPHEELWGPVARRLTADTLQTRLPSLATLHGFRNFIKKRSLSPMAVYLSLSWSLSRYVGGNVHTPPA